MVKNVVQLRLLIIGVSNEFFVGSKLAYPGPVVLTSSE